MVTRADIARFKLIALQAVTGMAGTHHGVGFVDDSLDARRFTLPPTIRLDRPPDRTIRYVPGLEEGPISAAASPNGRSITALSWRPSGPMIRTS